MYAGQGKAGSVTTPEYMFSLTSSLLAQAEMDAQSSSQHIKQLAEIDKVPSLMKEQLIVIEIHLRMLSSYCNQQDLL